MGILHAGIVNSMLDARVKAICDKESLLIRLAKNLMPENITFYKDHVEMVKNEKLDAVFVTTPIDSHVPIVLDIVREDADVSLFVEKPLASSAAEAKKACDAVSKLSSINMVGFQKRFSPVFQKAKTLIQEGAIGDLMFFRAYVFSSDVLKQSSAWRFRRGTGGVLLDLAPHLLDILLWMFGEPNRVWAASSHVYSARLMTTSTSAMSFNSGLKGHLDACWSVRVQTAGRYPFRYTEEMGQSL